MGFRNLNFGSDRGIALPIVLSVLLIVTVLASVAAADAIRANHQSFRDRNEKRAFQAAVAGVQSANDQTTLLQPALDQCVVKDSSGNLTSQAVSGGWCTAQSDDLGDGAGYTEYVSAGTQVTDATTGQHLVRREIVSTGTVNGVTRRVDVIVNAAIAAPLFPSQYAAVSLDEIDWGNGVRATGNVGSNHDINLINDAQICGDAITPGAITTKNTATICGDRKSTSGFVLDPVDPGTAPAASNSRLHYLTVSGQVAGSNDDPCGMCSRVSWNESTRVLSLSNQATLTLGGNSYMFCKVNLSNNAQIQVATGATVKIYIDSPEHCASAGSGAGSVTFTNSSHFVNSSANPTALQVYMIGSSSVPTTLDIGNGFGSQLALAIYAPYSAVYLHNAVQIRGALAAKSIPIDNGASITYDPLVGGISGGGIPVYRSTRNWIECTTKPISAAVNSGCWDS